MKKHINEWRRGLARIWSVARLRGVIIASGVILLFGMLVRIILSLLDEILSARVMSVLSAVNVFIEALSPNLLASIVFYLMLAEGVRTLHGLNIEVRTPDTIISCLESIRPGEDVEILDISLLTYLSNDQYKNKFLSLLSAILIQQNSKVKLLLANPDSLIVKTRARQLHNGNKNRRSDYYDNLVDSLKILSAFRASLPETSSDKFTVRLYTVPPGIAYYGLGLQAFAAVYPQSKITDDAPNLAFQDNDFQKYFRDFFESIWKDPAVAKPVESFRQADCSVCGGPSFTVWFLNRALTEDEECDMVSDLAPDYLLCAAATGGVALHNAQNKNLPLRLIDKSGIYLASSTSIIIDSTDSENISNPAELSIFRKFSWLSTAVGTSGILAKVCPVAYEIRKKGFCLYGGASLKRLLLHEKFRDSWDHLGEDTYYSKAMQKLNPLKSPQNLSKRQRSLGKYNMTWDGEDINLSYLDIDEEGNIQEIGGHKGHASFYQRPEVNKSAGGLTRWFERINPNLANHELAAIVRSDFLRFAPFVKPASKTRSQNWNVTVHQIRVICPPRGEGEPTPEGIHCDGHDLLVIHVINRQNVADNSGISSVYERQNVSNNGAHHSLHKVIAPGDSLFINDQEVLHCVSHFEPLIQSKQALRDVLLVDFDLVDNYPHCNM